MISRSLVALNGEIMRPAQTLISFAKSRKRAFKAYGALDHEREKAAAEILRRCEFFLKTDKCGWVNQLRKEIEILLPSSDSEDAHWIEKINQFINLKTN